MQGPRILVLTAIKSEFRALARVVRGRADLAPPIGVGAIRLTGVTSRPLVVLAGLAGGLDPALKVGDVVVDAASTTAAADHLPYPRVSIACCAHVVGTVAEKAELFRRTTAAVVDMESAAVRDACAGANVPYLGLRAVSDAATDAIDPAILKFVDPFGGVKVAALGATLLKRPALITDLRKLSRASSLALSNLSDALDTILDFQDNPVRPTV